MSLVKLDMPNYLPSFLRRKVLAIDTVQSMALSKFELERLGNFVLFLKQNACSPFHIKHMRLLLHDTINSTSIWSN